MLNQVCLLCMLMSSLIFVVVVTIFMITNVKFTFNKDSIDRFTSKLIKEKLRGINKYDLHLSNDKISEGYYDLCRLTHNCLIYRYNRVCINL